MNETKTITAAVIAMACLYAGCTPSGYSSWADRVANATLDDARQHALAPGEAADFDIAFRPVQLDHPNAPGDAGASDDAQPARTLTLRQALRVAFSNSLAFQQRKEELYLEALAVANSRHDWSGLGALAEGDVTRTITAEAPGDNAVNVANGSAGVSFVQKFKHGGALTLAMGATVASNLLDVSGTSFTSTLSANLTQPLLRGAWFGFAYEDLYRQERDLLISVFEFERYRQTFCTGIIENYYSVLQEQDVLANEQANIERLELALRRTRLQVEGGEATRVEQNQAERDLFNARARLMTQRTRYLNALDSFKITIGLPIRSRIELDRSALTLLSDTEPEAIPLLDESAALDAGEAAAVEAAADYDQRRGAALEAHAAELNAAAENAAAESSSSLSRRRLAEQIRRIYIDRRRQSAYDAAFDEAVDAASVRAAEIALQVQPEVLREAASVRDARRDMEKAANDFLPGLDLDLTVAAHGAEPRRPQRIEFHRNVTDAKLVFDYDFDQTDNRDQYREAQLLYDRSIREAVQFVDEVRQDIRGSYRQLVESRRNYDIRKRNLALALRQQKLTAMEQAEGRSSTRDLLEAEDDLRSAQNDLTSSAVDYETSRLAFLASLGLLEAAADGRYVMRTDPQVFEMIERRYGGAASIFQAASETPNAAGADQALTESSDQGEHDGNDSTVAEGA